MDHCRPGTSFHAPFLRATAMMSAAIALARLILLILITSVADLSANGGTPDTSSPEAAIQTYYRGYNLGDRDLIKSTFLRPVVIEPLGLGDQVHYQIIAKRTVTDSAL